MKYILVILDGELELNPDIELGFGPGDDTPAKRVETLISMLMDPEAGEIIVGEIEPIKEEAAGRRTRITLDGVITI